MRIFCEFVFAGSAYPDCGKTGQSIATLLKRGASRTPISRLPRHASEVSGPETGE